MSNSNADQAEFWTRFAEVWVTHQEDLDGLFAPVLDRLLDLACLKAGQQVLDIGCGTGTSTLLAGQKVAPGSAVLGVDISLPMIARARQMSVTASNVSFAVTDAAEENFAPSRFDHVISRFGVMFFSDPVSAFQNIAKGLKPGASLTMAAWSHLDVNPWFLTPMRAAKARLGAPPALDADAPGPLAFRDIDRVCHLLEQAGLIDVTGVAESIFLTPPGDLQRVSEHASHIGPAARTMEHFEGTEEDFFAISKEVSKGFAAHMTSDGARIPAEINFFKARV